jgi:hypothetical protein
MKRRWKNRLQKLRSHSAFLNEFLLEPGPTHLLFISTTTRNLLLQLSQASDGLPNVLKIALPLRHYPRHGLVMSSYDHLFAFGHPIQKFAKPSLRFESSYSRHKTKLTSR